MTKRVSSLVLAIVMLLQMLVPQTTIAKEGVKAPSDNLVKVGLINSNSYDSKLMLELNRLTAKSRGKRSAEPGTRLFGYFDEGQDPKDEDKLKYHGEVKAELSVKGLDGNPFQWKEIFGTEELHLRFIQMNDDTGVETGTERVLNITQAGTYTWTDGDGEPAELPLFNNKLEPLTYEVKLDEEVSDKVKLLTARFTTTGNAGSPTFEKPDADGRIKYHLTLEIGLQQVASSKFVSEWHTAVRESDRPQLVGIMTGSMVSGKSKTININLPTNDDAEVIVRTASRRDKNKFLPEFLFKKPTVKLVETNENDLAFDTTNKTVTSGDHKFKYDFTYDVINGGKLTMTEILPVTFDANGGKFASLDENAEQKIKSEVDYEKDVTAPKAPTKEGETFIGWGDKAEATTPVMADAFKGIKEAKTFYAIFTKDIIEQEGKDKPTDVPTDHVKVTVDVTDKAKLGEGEKKTRIFWVDPKKEVTLPVAKPTGKDVPVDDTNPKEYTWVFTKWTSDEAAPRTWSDGITATFPKETTITANYDKNITDQGTVEGKGITVHESYKDGETWVNNFIPEANTLKAAVKVKDTNGNEEDLPEGATVELVDDGGAPYADEAALTNALYDKLQEKANPNDEPTRVETVKAKVTFKNGEVQIVDIPIKVIKNIYEAKTETKPPYYVPKDYVKVTLDPTKKATESQKTY